MNFPSFLIASLVAAGGVELFEQFTDRKTAWVLAILIVLSSALARPAAISTLAAAVNRLIHPPGSSPSRTPAPR